MENKTKQALSKCMAICSKSEKCISDIESKLESWGVGAADSEKIIAALISEKFIDQERYVRFFVRDKLVFNNWGKIKIAYMLRGKKIPTAVIDNALQQIDAEEYLQILENIMIQKDRKIKSDSEFEHKAKLIRFAQGRGFEYDAIASALANIANAPKD